MTAAQTPANGPRTLFDKIWDAHVVVAREDGNTLLYVDRHLCHEGSFHGFNQLRASGRTLRRPDRTFAVADHYVPTTSRSLAAINDPEVRDIIETFERNTREFGVTAFQIDDPAQGIVHVVGPEQGLTQPGLLICCGDSHTATHGALGAIAFGIGASEVAHVMATQTLWQRRPKTMRVRVEGERPAGVSAKDVILAIIARIGAAGATGHAVEFAGSVIRDLSVEERMTVCNMTIEAGGRVGMVAPDEKTIAYVKGRPYAPKGAEWDAAVAFWRTLPTDEGAPFDTEVELDGAALSPMVTWGTSPEDALPITERVPDPAAAPNAERRDAIARAIDYMGLEAGMPLADVRVDRVFIGSCTNSRLEDLRAAADVLRGRKAVIPAMVSPGSTLVKRQAEAEGLDRVFLDAGVEWRESGCSMCVGMNGDLVASGQRCASTSNRNFAGRQGQGARTHLVSPAMAAAAAVTGRLADVRQLA